jgi:hypothetical protein
MDLRALVQAADAGTFFPPVKVMAGGALYIGYVGTRAQRDTALKDGLSEYFYGLENPKRRSAAKDVYSRATAQGAELREILKENHDDTLSLLNCQVWPPGGDGIESRIVYLPFASIDSWWIGAEKRLKRRSPGAFFGGVLISMDGGSE